MIRRLWEILRNFLLFCDHSFFNKIIILTTGFRLQCVVENGNDFFTQRHNQQFAVAQNAMVLLLYCAHCVLLIFKLFNQLAEFSFRRVAVIRLLCTL